jgi:hypothetical protein
MNKIKGVVVLMMWFGWLGIVKIRDLLTSRDRPNP